VNAVPLIAAVELGGTKCICLLGRSPDDVIEQVRIDTRDPQSTLAAIEAVLDRWHVEHDFSAIGIASFGPLQLETCAPGFGSIVSTTKPLWSGTPVLPRFARFGVPAAIDTDVVGAARAEQRWGAARGLTNLAYVTVGTGVGVGAIIGDRSISGQGHGEMGHLRVPRLPGDDWPGICAFHGDCVEGLACGPAIAKRHGPGPVADDWAGWDSVEHALAMLIHNLLLSLQPQRIMMGGGVVSGRPQLIQGARQRAVQSLGNFYTAAGLADDFLVAPVLGDRAGPLGALAVGLSAVGH
jgi:fructokinase